MDKILNVLAVLLVGSICVQGQNQLDLKDFKVRQNILRERKDMNCRGIYEQTKLKLDAQLKVGNKIDASAGVSPQTLATMTEITTALGQSRRELCEFYKHDPEFKKDDYFRQVGDLDKNESDAALLFQYAKGKASESDLKSLKTVKAHESSTGTVDVNATLQEVVKNVDSVTSRIGQVEQRVTALETQEAPTRWFTREKAQTFVNDFSAVPPAPFWYITQTMAKNLTSDEQGIFSKQLAEMLVGAKWKDMRSECLSSPQSPPQLPCFLPIYEDVNNRGIIINSPQKFFSSAQALSKELDKFSIKNLVKRTDYYQSNQELPCIVIEVGIQ